MTVSDSENRPSQTKAWLVLGLIFSIKGLSFARRHALKKWPSICGIVFSCLIFLSFFVPLIASTFSSPE